MVEFCPLSLLPGAPVPEMAAQPPLSVILVLTEPGSPAFAPDAWGLLPWAAAPRANLLLL